MNGQSIFFAQAILFGSIRVIALNSEEQEVIGPIQLPLLCVAAVASSCADDGSADLQGPLQRQVNLGQAAAPEAMDPDQRVPAKSSINSPRYYPSGDQWRN